MSWQITTPSRLHFGLFSLPGQGEAEPFRERHYGGCGLMIREPGIQLRAEPLPRASQHTAAGPLAARVLHFAQRATEQLRRAGQQVPILHFQVLCCPPEHHGLGVGTQLGLATAWLLCEAARIYLPVEKLARLVGRGQRSAIGVHGFRNATGFLIEGGKQAGDSLSPLLWTCDFPDPWRVVVMIPRQVPGLHGTSETEAFARLVATGRPLLSTGELCRLALLGMAPALVEEDFTDFSEALYEFNRKVGEAFAPIQGGVYAPGNEPIVNFVRRLGLPGTGQSSWGPALFAICADPEQATFLARRVREQFTLPEEQVILTRATSSADGEDLPF